MSQSHHHSRHNSSHHHHSSHHSSSHHHHHHHNSHHRHHSNSHSDQNNRQKNHTNSQQNMSQQQIFQQQQQQLNQKKYLECQICNKNQMELFCDFIKKKSEKRIFCQDCFIKYQPDFLKTFSNSSSRQMIREQRNLMNDIQVISMILDNEEIKLDIDSREKSQYKEDLKQVNDILSNNIQDYDYGLDMLEFQLQMHYIKQAEKTPKQMQKLTGYKEKLVQMRREQQKLKKEQIEGLGKAGGIESFFQNLPALISNEQYLRQHDTPYIRKEQYYPSGYNLKQSYSRGLDAIYDCIDC